MSAARISTVLHHTQLGAQNMANFKLYPGLFVRVMKEKNPYNNIGDVLQEGEVLQVLNTRYFLSFVGKYGTYDYDSFLEPLYTRESNDT